MAKVYSFLKPYTIITFGLIVYAIGLTAFLIPAKITGGGISGVATIIYFATGFPVGYGYLLLNIVLLVIAIRALGANFGVKTIFAVIMLSGILAFFQTIFKARILADTFLTTVIGGILTGTGIGIVFTQGGSTGGTDIIALIINKNNNIRPGRIILYIDVFIISSSYIILRSVESVVYGYVAMAITGYVIDLVLSGSQQSVQMLICSKRYDEIAERVGKEVGRGITLLDGQGYYLKEQTKILMILTKKQESSHVFRIIKDIDPNAFISISNVSGVYGKGFDKLKI